MTTLEIVELAFIIMFCGVFSFFILSLAWGFFEETRLGDALLTWIESKFEGDKDHE